ncbi:MAG: hypothetical protein KAH64_02110, partial [Nitrosomonadaceae bacterium]|nr:hypothetical protein [Nitrosomonadaceae bacterium]
PNVAIVNLLGIEDNFVGPLEVIDFAGVLAGDTKIFFIQVPCSDHLNIITVSLRPSKVDKRGRLLLVAMVGIVDGMPTPVLSFKNPVHETVTSHSIPLKYLDDNFSFTRNTDTKHLVFVIHGIRDDGYWTKKVAARIKQRGNNTTEIFASNTKSYGYYTAFPFALPWIRRQKVEWFMDEYATAKALHPKAVFSYVGHSNGTYLAAKALEDYQSCVFERIVFAGSVVRKNYDWCSKFISEVPKVGKLLNYVATNDVVVALFPKGLQTLRLFNLGSAGHDGFDQAEKCPNQIKQLKFVKGGHGAGIQESRWDEISEFIIDGTTPNVDALPENDYQNSRSSSVVAIGYMSTAILFFLVFVIIAVGWALFAPLIDHTWSSTSTSISSWFSVVGMENCINVVTTSLDKLWECYNSLEKKVNAAAVTFYGIFIWYILFRF